MKTLCFASMSSFVVTTFSFFHVALQPAEARLPARRDVRDPFADRREPTRLEPVPNLAPASLPRDHSRLAEKRQVFGDGLAADRQAVRKLRRGGGPSREPAHQLTAGRISERGEEILLHVQPDGCTS